MRKIDKKEADAYFRLRTTLIIIYLAIGFTASFGVVFFAEELSGFSINGFPFHYFMGAQGAVLIFILLLFINAIVNDQIDKKFGIDQVKKRG
ncbi:MAG TPA: sodium/substrate symporter small subunit [Planococcus sp. (in: firmicutes)]|nr:sodium/substrate symporter small subunit [Planococcus sp. (in: firmicutes)]